MGVCVSFQNRKQDRSRGGGGGSGSESSIRGPSSTINVILVDGRLQELKYPIQASAVTSQNPNCFLCSSELMSVGSCAPQVPADEDLQSDQIYFLMPLSLAQTPLSLHDLCALAVKASAALPKDGLVRFSSSSSSSVKINHRKASVLNKRRRQQPML